MLELPLQSIQSAWKIRTIVYKCTVEKPCITLLQIDTLGGKQKEMEHKGMTKVSPLCIHCTYCSMPKGMSRDEVTSNSEKINPIALAIIVLRLPEGRQTMQAGGQAGSRKFH